MPAHDTFLDPLKKLALRHPEIEAHVLWFANGEWSDAMGEVLEAEEIAFYAEGLLLEGFGAAWQHLVSAAGDPHLRLLFWQTGAPVLPDPAIGWALMAQGLHPA